MKLHYDFDPELLKPDKYAPPVGVFTELRKFNQPVKLPTTILTLDSISLAYSDKIFSIQCRCPSTILATSPQYLQVSA